VRGDIGSFLFPFVGLDGAVRLCDAVRERTYKIGTHRRQVRCVFQCVVGHRLV
jgi:hypothetical protein